jgi:serine/threonine-protein kinase
MATAPVSPKLAEMTYKIVSTIGQGAGSTIFLITDQKFGGKYALKVVKRQGPEDDIYVDQVQHEFEVAQCLRHRCILKVHDLRIRRSWLKVSAVEMLMEYVDGRTLDNIALKDNLGQLVLIFNQVAAGLMHMHRRGVYHGDLKPSNVMLSRAGVVKIIDFGTAWLKGHDKGRVQGTPEYMAPEQASEKVVDEKTDLYNFGALMYRLLTGEYANLGLPSVAAAALGGRNKLTPPIDYNHDIPKTLNSIVMACLQLSPERRPSNVFEVRHQIVATAQALGLKEEDLHGSEGADPDED